MNIVKEHLEINMRMLNDNTKMDVKETVSVFRLNSLLPHGESGILEMLIRLFLHSQ